VRHLARLFPASHVLLLLAAFVLYNCRDSATVLFFVLCYLVNEVRRLLVEIREERA
jgi:hypothetical protein